MTDVLVPHKVVTRLRRCSGRTVTSARVALAGADVLDIEGDKVRLHSCHALWMHCAVFRAEVARACGKRTPGGASLAAVERYTAEFLEGVHLTG